MTAGWAAVETFALGLPDTVVGTSYGRPAVKVNDKAFVTHSGEVDSFHVASLHEEKAILIATDPATFWQTPHFANWPGLLVRFAAADPDRVRRVIVRAWWDRAKSAQRSVYGERP